MTDGVRCGYSVALRLTVMDTEFPHSNCLMGERTAITSASGGGRAAAFPVSWPHPWATGRLNHAIAHGRFLTSHTEDRKLVEWRRIELPTFALRTRRSPS